MLSQYNRWCILILIFEICLFLFLFSLSFLLQFYLPPVQHFILTWGKSNKDIYHLSPNVAGNILITTYPLKSSACFQHHFQNWFSVLILTWNLNEYYHYLTLPECVICQIETNCSPVHSLNMLPFHIRLKRLKLTFYSLISNFPGSYLKTGIFCLLSFSSHVEVDSNYFGVLLLKILKPRENNSTNSPIGKIFQTYKPIRHNFVMSQK